MEQSLNDPAFKGGVLSGQVPQTIIWDDITLRIMFNFYERSLHIIPLGSEPSEKRPVGLWKFSLWEQIFVLRTKPRERSYAIVYGLYLWVSSLFRAFGFCGWCSASCFHLWILCHDLLYIFLTLGQVDIDLFIIFQTIFILVTYSGILSAP